MITGSLIIHALIVILGLFLTLFILVVIGWHIYNWLFNGTTGDKSIIRMKSKY